MVTHAWGALPESTTNIWYMNKFLDLSEMSKLSSSVFEDPEKFFVYHICLLRRGGAPAQLEAMSSRDPRTSYIIYELHPSAALVGLASASPTGAPTRANKNKTLKFFSKIVEIHRAQSLCRRWNPYMIYQNIARLSENDRFWKQRKENKNEKENLWLHQNDARHKRLQPNGERPYGKLQSDQKSSRGLHSKILIP